VEIIRELGLVKLVQLQPNGLIIQKNGKNYYDVTRRVQVEELTITRQGIEAFNLPGERLLDVHHLDHPGKKYGRDDLVCLGFTSHYHKMQERFGEHIFYGSAGENIIIDYPHEIWLEDLGDLLAFENQETGKLLVLDQVQVANPCEAFSQFAAQSRAVKLPSGELKDILQFLGSGRRGFLMVLKDGQAAGVIRPGDKVYCVKDQ
jgi:MOSC domain-containing protein YiiM